MPLPPFLIDRGEPTWPDLKAAYALTGYFLQNWLLAPDGGELPDAREGELHGIGAQEISVFIAGDHAFKN